MATTASEIRAAMKRIGADWKVAADSMAIEAAGARDSGYGLGLAVDVDEQKSLLRAALRMEAERFAIEAPPPAKIDWRKKDNKNWVTPVRRQGQCGACVSFATLAVVEARLNIKQNKPGRNVDLSEAHLFFCGDGSCASGWQIPKALRRAKQKGVGLESAFPYQSAQIACQEIASVIKVPSHSAAVNTVARKQAIATGGPVIAGMNAFEDFRLYAGGVYRHVSGSSLGGHAVCIIGYDDSQQCWIGKNSWGPGWGEQGFFRIAYGECGIDTQFAFYDPEVVALPAFTG